MANALIGNVFIVAAPSGGGKTSLVNKLIIQTKNIQVSVSHTTRSARPGEKHGEHYFFVNESEFMAMVNDNLFIEHAKVFEHYYGTSISQINNRLAAGIDVVLDIDWQGAQQIKQIYPHAISIFIIPPSLDALKNRLQNRGQDNEQVIMARMQQAQDELSHYPEFDYLIINENFDQAAAELSAIVLANRVCIRRQVIENEQLLSALLAIK